MGVAVARAHRWLALLEEGRFGSVGELAEAVGMDPSLVRRHLGLTALRPELTRQILNADEPDGLSLDEIESLLRRVAGAAPVAGAGLTGLRPAPGNVAPLARLLGAARLLPLLRLSPALAAAAAVLRRCSSAVWLYMV